MLSVVYIITTNTKVKKSVFSAGCHNFHSLPVQVVSQICVFLESYACLRIMVRQSAIVPSEHISARANRYLIILIFTMLCTLWVAWSIKQILCLSVGAQLYIQRERMMFLILPAPLLLNNNPPPPMLVHWASFRFHKMVWITFLFICWEDMRF